MPDILENTLSTITENCKINDGFIKYEQIQITINPEELISKFPSEPLTNC